MVGANALGWAYLGEEYAGAVAPAAPIGGVPILGEIAGTRAPRIADPVGSGIAHAQEGGVT